MTKFRACFGILLSGAVKLGASAVLPPLLHLTTENLPPDVMLEGGEIVGASTGKIREIMARAGISYDITVLPWRRAYTKALLEAHTCVYSTTRTPEREHSFKWIGPTREVDWTLYGRADRGYKLRSLDDARGLSIGVYNGDARGDYLLARGFSIETTQRDELNAQKLMLGRIDLWAASSDTFASQYLLRFGWDKLIVPVFTFHTAKLYLACNAHLDDALVARMNAALEQMNRDGSAKILEHKYDDWKYTRPAVEPPASR